MSVGKKVEMNRIRKAIELFLVCGTVFSVWGCATPYQPLQQGVYGPGGGYSSRQIGENEYEVFFAGNGFTSTAKVADFWHRKARELCGSSHYKSSIQLTRNGGFPTARGTVTCQLQDTKGTVGEEK